MTRATSEATFAAARPAEPPGSPPGPDSAPTSQALDPAPPSNSVSAESRYAELARIAGGLAHEIRNPLSTMRLNLDLLAEEFRGSDSIRDRRALTKIERLRKETLRLQNVLEDFLRFAHLERIQPVDQPLAAVVNEVCDFWEPQAQAHGIVVRVYHDPQPSCSPLDADLFKQAILNLLLNAQQAMPDGGELMLITRRAGAWNVLEVVDTGVGIPASLRDKVFEPFQTTKPGGSGLGLPMVRRIVEAHGGRIAFESEPGKGTKFTIWLPCSPEGDQIHPPAVELNGAVRYLEADPRANSDSPAPPVERGTSSDP
jgi:signal transduction histidine kinase